MIMIQKTTFITTKINTGTKSEIAYDSNFSFSPIIPVNIQVCNPLVGSLWAWSMIWFSYLPANTISSILLICASNNA